MYLLSIIIGEAIKKGLHTTNINDVAIITPRWPP